MYLLVIASLAGALANRRRLLIVEDGTHHDSSPWLRWALTIWGALILVGLIGLTVASFFTDRAAAQRAARPQFTVKVIANQWWWDIIYTTPDVSQMVHTANELHLPVGVEAEVTLQSNDVIHSFWVPNLAGKQDLIPGRTTDIQLLPRKAGLYRGQCAEFCGTQHANMALVVTVESDADFLRWIDAQRRPAMAPVTPLQVAGYRYLTTRECSSCHNISGTPAGGQIGPDLTHLASRRTIGALMRELRVLIEGDDAAVGRLFPAAYRDDPNSSADYDELVRGELVAGRVHVSLPTDNMRQLAYALGLQEDLVRYLGVKDRKTKEPLAREVAEKAAGDPFAGLVAGYVLLRLGRHQELEALASAVLGAASGLSDAYILRGEHEACAGRSQAAAQAFAEAIGTGVPAFGEGLTRLVEGLRALRLKLRSALDAGGRGGGGAVAMPLRFALTIGQIACAVLLVISAGLLVRSLWRLSHTDPGFQAADVVAVLDEVAGQGVEKSLIRGRVGDREVVHWVDEAPAEVVGPDSVDKAPREEWIGRRAHPLEEADAGVALGRQLGAAQRLRRQGRRLGPHRVARRSHRQPD